MDIRCERNGQTEIGIITHEGREFAALGSSVNGVHVAGYLGKGDTLQTFCGRTMLATRSERTESYHDENWGDTFGIIFYLTRGRAIVGYCLGEGSLFRGELVYLSDHAKRSSAHQRAIRELCRIECEYWLDIDAEDAERFQAELDAEDAQ